MAVDHYAPCPCGSGKKLKFCKCVDQPQEYEKIVRLIEGGQGLAAIDRINHLLEKTPNTAWLLALKGELTLTMQESESFKETVDRFLRLKPDNPLALVMKSIVALLEQEPIENAAKYLLEGMSESRETLPSLVLPAIRLLLNSLAATGKLCLVGYWSSLLTSLTGQAGSAEEDSIQQDSRINLIAKLPIHPLADGPGAEWKERLAEVVSLAGSFRHSQAETKLRSILRDFPDQLGPLSQLLLAQCAQLDQHGAAATARKLADHLQVPAEDRPLFAALAMELEPDQTSLHSPSVTKYCEVDSEERVYEALKKLDFVTTSPVQHEPALQHFAYLVQDQIPAKRIYTIFDKSQQATTGDSVERVIACAIGNLVIYGKQTDQPTRALLIVSSYAANQDRIDQLLDALQLGAEIDDVDLAPQGYYVDLLQCPKSIVGQPTERITIEERGSLLVEDFLNMRIAVLGDQTPLEAAEDEPKRAALLGLLYHLEGEQSIVVEPDAIDEIYRRLDITRPAARVNTNADSLTLTHILDIERIDVETLTDGSLSGLMVRSMSLGATRVFYRCAMAIRSRESLAGEFKAQIAAISGLLAIVPNLDQRIELCKELETRLAQANAPVGKVVVQHMSLLMEAGRPDEAQQVMVDATQKYPTDPYLLSFLQHVMETQGGGAPGGPGPANNDLAARMLQKSSQPSSPAAASDAGGSGLVLPGQQSDSSNSGESKLWLPGS